MRQYPETVVVGPYPPQAHLPASTADVHVLVRGVWGVDEFLLTPKVAGDLHRQLAAHFGAAPEPALPLGEPIGADETHVTLRLPVGAVVTIDYDRCPPSPRKT